MNLETFEAAIYDEIKDRPDLLMRTERLLIKILAELRYARYHGMAEFSTQISKAEAQAILDGLHTDPPPTPQANG